MINKILITGGKGFIGSHLVEPFSKINEVSVYDIKQDQNILDFEKLRKFMRDIDYIFHAAALVSVPESVQKPIETEEVNVKGTLNVLQAAVESGVKKVIFFSSAAVYGELPELPKRENMKLDPKSPYALSKISGEHYMKLFAEEFGLDTVTLRCFNIYGQGQNPDSPYAAVVPIFIKRALEGKPLIIHGDGEQTRDFIYIKDVVKACELALDKNFKGDVINISSNTQTSVKELANKILQLTNSNSEIKFEKERLGDVKHSYASNELAREKLGWMPEYNLERGLKETIDWFKSSKD